MRPHEAFIAELNKQIANNSHQKAKQLLQHFDSRRLKALSYFQNLELAKQRAAYIRWKVTESLDKYLVDFEASLLRKGGKVVWAYDAANALQELDQIITRTKSKKIVKSKTSLSSEIGLMAHLKGNKDLVVNETGVGDYLIELTEETPFHPVLPSVNLQHGETNKKLNTSIRSSLEADNQELMSDLREEIRRKYLEADLGITGANFLIADAGMVAISENEGNARLCYTFSKTHVVLASIDKIIPSISDLELFFPLLSTHASGQQLSAFNTIVGPATRDEHDGPQEFIVILIDNGRSSVMASQDQRQALTCIGCGACHNVCPVFTASGGTALYQGAKSGPIGQVINPLQSNLESYKHLSNASTLCGRCTDVCPVKIDLHNHLVRNRHDSVGQGLEKTGEKLAWYTWKKFMLNRKNMNRPPSIKGFTLKQFYKNEWGEQREFPKLAEKTFNQLWREKYGEV